MKHKHIQRSLILLAVVSIILFINTAVIARGGTIVGFEELALRAIYGLPLELRPVMIALTLLGSTFFFIGLMILLAIIKKRLLLMEVFLTGSLTITLVQLAKTTIDRPRPMVILTDIKSRELLVNGLGFPSGHTALATALSLTLVPYLPKKWRWLPVAWIPLVGLSRVYLGVHGPLDIVGGFAIGLFVVAIQQFIVRNRRTGLKKL